jgi:(2Fe-2S) ferredoxin
MGKATEKFKETEPFALTGQFLGFSALESYKLKYLRLQANAGVYLIKIPKEQRLELYRTLKTGAQVRCVGEKRIREKDHHRQVTYRASEISINPEPQQELTAPVIRVLICNKSDCRQQGSEAIARVCQAKGAVVQFTGCQKQCKQAPNLVIHTPQGKRRFSRVSPEQVTEILDNCCPR